MVQKTHPGPKTSFIYGFSIYNFIRTGDLEGVVFVDAIVFVDGKLEFSFFRSEEPEEKKACEHGSGKEDGHGELEAGHLASRRSPAHE